MELTILKITRDRYRDISASLISDVDDMDFENLQSGDYALVKIESLSDQIAVEQFIEQLKNK